MEKLETLDRLITQAQRAERELSQLQANFIDTASHEFRTPLTIIDAAARRLDRGADRIDPVDIRVKAAIIRSTVTRIVDLVERMVELSRLTTQTFMVVPDTVSLRGVIESACSHEALAGMDCEVLSDLSACPEETVGDSRFIGVIAEKLVLGAAKLVVSKGRLEIAAWREEEVAVLSIKAISEMMSSDALQAIVRQLGSFMSAKHLLDEGMEFKLVRFLVEMHRGEIEFYGDGGRVFEIEVRLPVSFAAPSSQTPEIARQSA